jgi:hypothetical protein
MTMKTVTMICLPLASVFAVVHPAAAEIGPDGDKNYCGDGACTYPETPDKCPVDCEPPVCGDDVCDGGETFQTCEADCMPGTAGGPACGPFSDMVTWGGAFGGKIASGRAGVLLAADGVAGTIDNTLRVMSDATIGTTTIPLLDLSANGKAVGTAATGSAAIGVFGFTVVSATMGGTAALKIPLKTWTLLGVSVETPEICETFFNFGCVKASATADLSAILGFDVEETVSNTSVGGLLGPEGSVTATVKGTGAVCFKSCSFDALQVSFGGTATLVDLRVGAATEVTATTGSLAAGAFVKSNVGLEGILSLGAGSIDLQLSGCVFGFCVPIFGGNALNFGPVVTASWWATPPKLHCL